MRGTGKSMRYHCQSVITEGLRALVLLLRQQLCRPRLRT